MANMSAKFEEEAHKGLVSIMFTNLFPYMCIVTLTFDLWPPKSIGSILSLWPTCMMNKHTESIAKAIQVPHRPQQIQICINYFSARLIKNS